MQLTFHYAMVNIFKNVRSGEYTFNVKIINFNYLVISKMSLL